MRQRDFGFFESIDCNYQFFQTKFVQFGEDLSLKYKKTNRM
jgi:hypothetical protein